MESESESWKEKEALNRERAKTVVGDCMLCAGIIAYLGAFPIDYRDDALKNWKRILTEQKILFDPHFQLKETLCDANTYKKWIS